ncbi:MAG: S9 family peptidase, partial [Acidobacteriota bacterium]|nr:S9 family peptidase [Acidobacteriota bacterium]
MSCSKKVADTAPRLAAFSARRKFNLLLLVGCLLMAVTTAPAQNSYRQPPKDVLSILDAPVTPIASISPTRDRVILATGVRYPPIADLAQPMLRLAGLRINPNTSGPHRAGYFVALSLKRIADGAETKISLPPNAQAGAPVWSADGKHFAFTNTMPGGSSGGGIELWIGESETGKVQKLKGIAVNAVYGAPVQWLLDSRTLLVQTIAANRKALAAAPGVPREPIIQESSGRAGPVRTYQDLLRNPYDEAQFDYYATTQLMSVDALSGKATPMGKPAIFETVEPAPDGKHLLIAYLQRPYSYLHPLSDFPKEVEVWDLSGKMLHKLASVPLQDQVPIDGVMTGPRNYAWRPTEAATLVWVEALDDGDPKKKVPHRDRVLLAKAPFTGAPVELTKTEQRYAGMQWGEKGGMVLVSDYDRDRRWLTTRMLNADSAGGSGKVLFSRSVQDRYNDPGAPQTRVLPTGHRAIMQHGDDIFLAGAGASPAGDRPFLDRFNAQTQKAERLFRSDQQSYESVVTLLKDDGTQFMTRRETPTDPPNYFVRTLGGASRDVAAKSEAVFTTTVKSFTNFPDPTPQLRGIKKQLVTYKRADGVPLSFTLYL